MTVTLPSDHHDSYHTRPWLFTHEHHTWVCPSSVTLITQMIHYSWPSWLITIIYDHDSWLSSMTSLTYDYHDCYLWPSLITYDLWPLLITYDLWPSLMTYDLWPSLMTYDLWPMAYDYDLWPSSITSNYHLSPITVTHDYPWPWLITCHSWLIHDHD